MESAKANKGNKNKQKQKQTQKQKQKKKQKQQQQKQKKLDRRQQQSKAAKQRKNPADPKQVELFSHLPQFKSNQHATQTSVSFSENEPVHPAIMRLGLKFVDGKIDGVNARTLAMLEAFRHFIRDFTAPAGKSLALELGKQLKFQISYLVQCRQHTMAMGSVIKWVKAAIAKVASQDIGDDAQIKRTLCAQLQQFEKERIVFASQAIAENAMAKVKDGDVILTFGRVESVQRLLELIAKSAKKNVRVIVVDARPVLRSKPVMRQCAALGIACTYCQLSSVSTIIQDVSKVVLGASAVTSNGEVVGIIGTAPIAMIANASNVPVCVCSETFKFCERVQLDAIVDNELGDPDAIATTTSSEPSVLTNWRDTPRLKLLNLVYDLTPAQFVTVLVTEMGLMPPSSVPVVIREAQERQHRADSPS